MSKQQSTLFIMDVIDIDFRSPGEKCEFCTDALSPPVIYVTRLYRGRIPCCLSCAEAIIKRKRAAGYRVHKSNIGGKFLLLKVEKDFDLAAFIEATNLGG